MAATRPIPAPARESIDPQAREQLRLDSTQRVGSPRTRSNGFSAPAVAGVMKVRGAAG